MNDQFEIEQIDGTENLINKFKKLKKGLMQKLLTKGIGHSEFKKTEVGEIPIEWEVKKLEDISTVIMGQSPRSESYNEEKNGIPFFQGNSEFGRMYPTIKKWCSEHTNNAMNLLRDKKTEFTDEQIKELLAAILG